MEPFFIFPCDKAFLPELKTWLAERTTKNVQVTVIFPNRRSTRHFYELYAKDKKAAILPQVFTFEDMIKLWAVHLNLFGRRIASPLDQAAILYECVGNVAVKNKTVAKKFADMEKTAFLPWGLKLANLFEEIFKQQRKGVDIAHLEYEVGEPAASLLGSLGEIDGEYRKKLDALQWITPAYLQFLAAENAGNIPPALTPSPHRMIALAGFSNPTGCEETILKSLWKAGAYVCLQADIPPIIDKSDVPLACAGQEAWISRWRAKAESPFSEGDNFSVPQVKFFTGYDIHSQLRELNREIENNKESSTVIVLADENNLMPVLHDLDEKNINISMGYPMMRSAMGILLETIFSAIESDIGDKKFYWKDLEAIFAHPFTHLLSTVDEDGNPLYLRDAMKNASRMLRGEAARISLDEFLIKAEEVIDARVWTLFRECIELMLIKPQSVDSFGALAAYLVELRQFLLENGKDIWEKFPREAETIYRLSNNIIPVLQNNLFAEEKFSKVVLTGYLRQLLEGERIPFRMDILDNIQIMGLLETRLLNFDRVFLLDITDDKMPGNPPNDSLLPNSLRGALGLPDSRRREKNMDYQLYRLTKGAKEAHYYWQEGVTHSDVAEGKKLRSRFVEKLIWQKEKNDFKKILEPGDEVLRVARAPVSIPVQTPKEISITGEVRKKLDELLSRPLSATELDSYLECPLGFAYYYLLNIESPDTVCEGDNSSLAGKVVHEALKLFLVPYRGKVLNKNCLLDRKQLESCFEEAMKTHSARKFLPAHSQIKLEVAFADYIGSYLANIVENTELLDIETALTAEVELNGKDYVLKGRIDRIERRDDKLLVLDYKTGSAPVGAKNLWNDQKFFDEIAKVCKDYASYEILNEKLEELRILLPSLQLPFYITLLAANGKYGEPDNAAFVELGENMEYWLYDDPAPENRERLLQNCRTAITLVLEHLRKANTFIGNITDKCRFCNYQEICFS